MTARSPTVLLALLVACDPDMGRPTETIIVQDSGVEAAAADAASALSANGQSCTANEQCESGVCFVGNKSSFCSVPCTAANATTACAAPPFNGVCNQQGFCRLP
jgi:hypothetical protein